MVLNELLEHARVRARGLPVRNVQPCTRSSFSEALRGRERLGVIAEFKRKSPSEGGIAPGAAIADQLRAYAEAGAVAISVLTEPSRFAGSTADLVTAAESVALPLLLKDFVVDVRQVEEACALGASACLLIVRCLGRDRLNDLAQACVALGMTPLVECHDEGEVELALGVESAVIGVNNRDLDTLAIDIARAPRLLQSVGPHRIVVAESGYLRPAQTAGLRGLADGVLIGTSLMRSGDPGAFIRAVSQ